MTFSPLPVYVLKYLVLKKKKSKKKCDVVNKGEHVMGGVRTSHNCYNIVPSIKLGCNYV